MRNHTKNSSIRIGPLIFLALILFILATLLPMPRKALASASTPTSAVVTQGGVLIQDVNAGYHNFTNANNVYSSNYYGNGSHLTGITTSYAASSAYATNAGYATNSGYASYATNAGTATNVTGNLNGTNLTAGTVPPSALIATNSASFGKVYAYDNSGNGYWANAGTGTVTSVTLTGDGVLVTSTPTTPVTSSGTLNIVLANAAQNTVLAGPPTGGAGSPTYQGAPTFSGLNLSALPSNISLYPTLNQNTTGSSGSVSVITTLGDILYGGTGGATTRLAGNTSLTKKFLTQTGTSTISGPPVWNSILPADLPLASVSQVGGVQVDGTTIGVNGSGVISALGGGSSSGAIGGRNRIINGDFTINQRVGTVVSTSGTATSYVSCDRWYMYASGANATVAQATSPTNVVGSYFQNALRFTGATSNTGITFGQKIEASNIFDQATTTATMTVSFNAYASAAQTLSFGAYFANSGIDNWTTRGTIATSTFNITTTPTRFSYTIPAGGNLVYAYNGISIEFSLSSGLANGATLVITGVQLEPGSTMTTFEKVGIVKEVADCWWYFHSGYAFTSANPGLIWTAPGTATRTGLFSIVSNDGGTTFCSFSLNFAPMRTAPTLSYWDGAGTANKTSFYTGGSWSDGNVALTTLSSSNSSILLYAGSVGAFSFGYTLNAEL